MEPWDHRQWSGIAPGSAGTRYGNPERGPNGGAGGCV